MRKSYIASLILAFLAGQASTFPVVPYDGAKSIAPHNRRKIGFCRKQKGRKNFPLKQPRSQNYFCTSAKSVREKLWKF